MKYLSITDAKNKLDFVIDSIQCEPVTIKRRNQNVAVIISPNDYERLTRLNIQEFQKFRNMIAQKVVGRGLSEERLTTII